MKIKSSQINLKIKYIKFFCFLGGTEAIEEAFHKVETDVGRTNCFGKILAPIFLVSKFLFIFFSSFAQTSGNL